jgi:AraC-like DNA-binding protein
MLDADLSFEDLSRQVKADASFYRMLGSTGEEAPAVLRGDFFVESFRSGLHIHATDAVEQSDTVTELRLEPQVSVSIVFAGAPAAAIDGVELDLSVPDGAQAGGLIWSVARPALLRRTIRSGQSVKKVNVSVNKSWIEEFLDRDAGQDQAVRRFAESHTAIHAWYPSADTARGARKLLECLGSDGLLNRLSLEMLALGVLRDAFACIGQPATLSDDGDRAALLHRYIADNLGATLTLSSIAAANGMSVSTMQRVFKEAYGVTVVDHLRRSRLDLARKALIEEHLPIQQAAHIAGYTSAANFATAYRRMYGHAPSEEKREDE